MYCCVCLLLVLRTMHLLSYTLRLTPCPEPPTPLHHRPEGVPHEQEVQVPPGRAPGQAAGYFGHAHPRPKKGPAPYTHRPARSAGGYSEVEQEGRGREQLMGCC
jgi:hypothetical protein